MISASPSRPDTSFTGSAFGKFMSQLSTLLAETVEVTRSAWISGSSAIRCGARRTRRICWHLHTVDNTIHRVTMYSDTDRVYIDEACEWIR